MINIKKDSEGNRYIEVSTRGYDLIHEPLLNKGTSFSYEEMEELHLRGIIAPHQTNIDEVVEKTYQIVNDISSNLDRHIYLRSLQDRNETLFYALICKYPVEMMPLIYTPHVGEACMKYSEIYRRPRGVFIRYEDKNYIDDILSHTSFDDTEVIVVSDGERILGLGDQGAGGMGIPIGKLSLYTACAGVAPQKTLPILLDVGTNNEKRLSDPLYIGSRHERIVGKDYDNFIDLFVKSVKRRFPQVLLQWEDFAQHNALKILKKYQDYICSFNDDIQGTAAIVTGSLLSATIAAKSSIGEQIIVIVGAGSAGVGISNLIIDAMVASGLPRELALCKIYLVDQYGLLTENTPNKDFQHDFITSQDIISGWDVKDRNNISLLEVVTNSKATMLLGVCGQCGIFTKPIITEMLKNCSRPIIFPISNPNSKAEACPKDIYLWTQNRAIVGTGSPFPDQLIDRGLRRIDQVNNSYIFPGLGLGIIAVKSHKVTNKMFLVAAQALAELSPVNRDKGQNLLQPLTNIREISRYIAIAVASEAVKMGFTKYSNLTHGEITKIVEEEIWVPEYLPYKFKQ